MGTITERVQIPVKDLRHNTGQLPGVPRNPRRWTAADIEGAMESITEDPEMLQSRPPIVTPHNGVFVVICANLRVAAMKRMGYESIACDIYTDFPADKLKRIAAKDNGHYGEFDSTILEQEWSSDARELESWGIAAPWASLKDEDGHEPQKDERTADEPGSEDYTDDMGNDFEGFEGPDFASDEEDASEDSEKEDFCRSMYKDCLYESDNEYDIPTLKMSEMPGKLELPLSPWGANSRLRKDVTTYHFYVDDYRFEHLFKDPIKLLVSGCKAVVEPNCSIHDQTPVAWGLQLIYKKRWISRYFQECGIKVYADLNVSHKFREFNMLGIPKGYNAFFTRGLDGWLESLKLDLQTAQEISGLECPNLIVYGGGKDVQAFCREHNLLYVTDFINAKKI